MLYEVITDGAHQEPRAGPGGLRAQEDAAEGEAPAHLGALGEPVERVRGLAGDRVVAERAVRRALGVVVVALALFAGCPSEVVGEGEGVV